MRLTMADTPMGTAPVQNQPTPPSGACSPLPSPPSDISPNIGGRDDAKLPPSGNTLMPDVPPLLLGPSDGNKADRDAHHLREFDALLPTIPRQMPPIRAQLHVLVGVTVPRECALGNLIQRGAHVGELRECKQGRGGGLSHALRAP